MTERQEDKKMLDNLTQIWKEYEAGKSYLDKLNIIPKSNKAYRFYEGNHWDGLKSGDEQMPIIEILRPVVDYKVSVVTQNLLQIYYSPMNYDNPELQTTMKDICDKLNSHIASVWENKGMDAINVEVVRDACITGEKYLYMYFKPSSEIENGKLKDGIIEIETIDGANIYFGNEQETDIQKQPYILITLRQPLKRVREEAKECGLDEDEIRQIQGDDDTDTMVGRLTYEEVDNEEKKCLCVMKLYKEKGKIYIEKSVKNKIYHPKECTELSSYPVAKIIWNKIKGTCRGEGDVYKYIPNQIWVNKLEAYRLISAKMFAFPKTVYSSRIANAEDVTTVGAALEVDDDDVSAAQNAVAYISPAAMSSDAQIVMNELMANTKEAAGASDYALGNSDAKSAKAVLALQQANAMPLSSQTEQYKKYIEDIARIFYDFWCTYYPNGINVIDIKKMQTETGEQEIEIGEVIPQETLKLLKVKVKVDITANSPYDKITEQQKRDNLLTNNIITFEEYVELLPKDESMREELQNIVKKRNQQRMLEQQMLALQEENQKLSQTLQSAAMQYNDQSEQLKQQSEQAYQQGQIDNAITEMGV